MPVAASRSATGVRAIVPPFTPSASKRCWSVVMKRMLRRIRDAYQRRAPRTNDFAVRVQTSRDATSERPDSRGLADQLGLARVVERSRVAHQQVRRARVGE